MLIGVVKGTIHSTINHPFYDGHKLLIVARVGLDGEAQDAYLIAVDTVGAGVGETVLLIDEGGSARQVVAHPDAPLRSVIVGIVDAVDVA